MDTVASFIRSMNKWRGDKIVVCEEDSQTNKGAVGFGGENRWTEAIAGMGTHIKLSTSGLLEDCYKPNSCPAINLKKK